MGESVKEVTACVYGKNKDTEVFHERSAVRSRQGGSINLEFLRQWARGDGRPNGGHALPTPVHLI
jgi:hypothetical protein